MLLAHGCDGGDVVRQPKELFVICAALRRTTVAGPAGSCRASPTGIVTGQALRRPVA